MHLLALDLFELNIDITCVSQVTAVGHAAMLAAIQRYVPALVREFWFLEFQFLLFMTSKLMFFRVHWYVSLTDTIDLWTRKIGSLEASWETEGNGKQWRQFQRKHGGTSLSRSNADYVQLSILKINFRIRGMLSFLSLGSESFCQ